MVLVGTLGCLVSAPRTIERWRERFEDSEGKMEGEMGSNEYIVIIGRRLQPP